MRVPPRQDVVPGPEKLVGRATGTPVDLWIVGRDGCYRGAAPRPALARRLAPVVERAHRAGVDETLDLAWSDEDGRPRLARARVRRLSDDETAVMVLDLDGLNAVEQSLSRYDLVLRATHDAVWEWNVVTNEAWWNGRMYEMLGYDPASTGPSYEAWARCIHPDERARVMGGFERVLAGDAATWEDEFRFRQADGSYGVTLDRGYIERNGDGVAIRMIGVMSDVTAQRAATAALQASEERFRQLTAAIHDVFWMICAETREVLYVSSAYETLWGRSCESLYAAPGSFLDAVHPDDLPRVLAGAAAQSAGGFDDTYRIIRPDGTIAWVHDRSFPIRDASGAVIRIAGVASDITAQRDLEERLAQAQKMESIGRLAGGVAHDFNNLLTVILSGTQFAMRRLSDADIRADLGHVKEAAERAATLTSQLLAFARRQVIAPTRLDLGALVRQMEELLRRLIGEHIELTTELTTELGAVLADRNQIEQVLINLAVNARDAMPDGGRLSLTTANLSIGPDDAALNGGVPEGDYVVLAVSDTGLGMSPEVQEHIFEPFFTTKLPGHGIGLGLATCYGIVRQAGGQILVDSGPGRGTTFKILLPRNGAAAVAADARHDDLTPRGTETVLFVEDDAAVRAMGIRMLALHGYRVLQASGGTEALRVAAEHAGPVHILITDVVMPHMSGTELGRKLADVRPEARVLFTSGYTESEIVQHGVLEPGVAFLQKPYVFETLLTKVRDVLDRA